MVKNNKQRGITLVALIITVIVLLILAMVSISLVINSGIINKAKYVVDKYSEEEELEQIQLAVISAQLKGNGFLTTENLNSELQAKFGNDKAASEISIGWFLNLDKSYRIYKDGHIENADLPAEYQQVEYIESNGSQYINTKFIPNQDLKVEVKYYANLDISQDIKVPIYGNNDNYYFFRNSYLLSYTKYGSSANNWSNALLTEGTIFQNKNIFTLANGRKCILNSNEFSSNTPIFIFNICDTNESPSCSYTNNSVKIYSFKIWNDESIVRNFIPCYNITTEDIGLYDTVEGKFYTNQGSGTFLKGNDV